MALPVIAAKVGRKRTHAINLTLGGLGLISIMFITSPEMKWLLNLSMIGVGIAWASILAMPYAILAGSIPARKWAFIWVFSISLSLFRKLLMVFSVPDREVFMEDMPFMPLLLPVF